MIDIAYAKIVFKDLLDTYEEKSDLSFELKKSHSYNVMDYSRKIAEGLNLSAEDVELAELIGLLHDIGRFEELRILKEFDNIKFDHAAHGSKMLFEKGIIRKFITDNQYDDIIKKAIENHSRLEIEANLDERTLLHSKIIRDADKIDNFRVKRDEKIEAIFSKKISRKEDVEESELTDIVYNTILSKKCVDIRNRKTTLDFWGCVLAFTFDLNFPISYKIIKENNYINDLIDRFEYKDTETKNRMENVRKTINKFIDEKEEQNG